MISHHTALVYTMVLMSAADSDMSDNELRMIGDIIGHLPVFQDFESKLLPDVASSCAELLDQEEGCPRTCARRLMRLPATLPRPTWPSATRRFGFSR